jgi:single-strand DNA-binding protein
MTDINHVVLVGRLTRDSETKFTASGQAVCKFSIAVNRKRKSGDTWEDEANFFDIVLWGRQAEAVGQYLVKGKQVAIDGELRLDRWEQDGQKRSKVEIVASNLQLLGGGQGGGDSSYAAKRDSQESWQQPQNAPQGSREGTGSERQGSAEPPSDDFSDDIPF